MGQKRDIGFFVQIPLVEAIIYFFLIPGDRDFFYD